MGIPIKPAEHTQTKDRDKFLLLPTRINRNSFQLQMAAAWKQQKASKVTRSWSICVPAYCYLYSRVVSTFIFVWGSKEGTGEGFQSAALDWSEPLKVMAEGDYFLSHTDPTSL